MLDRESVGTNRVAGCFRCANQAPGRAGRGFPAGRVLSWRGLLLLLLPLLLAGVEAQAAGRAAGSLITNFASATFAIAGVPAQADSNTDSFAVDELLDLTLVRNDAGNANATTPDTNVPLSFTLTNTGNGAEAFALLVNPALTGDAFDPQNVRIYIDNSDGVFDIRTDTLYVAGVNEPNLAADAARVLFVVSDMPAGLTNGDIGLVSLQARATTGSGTPGTLFAGAGTGGVDAVVGTTTAAGSAQNGYAVAQVTTTLVKSQVVLDPLGRAYAVSGATITYTLVFTVAGTGTILNARIQDAIPANTTYVPGSLTLNGASLTDAPDGDAGHFAGTQIDVAPGTAGAMPAPGTATVSFQVTIN